MRCFFMRVSALVVAQCNPFFLVYCLHLNVPGISLNKGSGFQKAIVSLRQRTMFMRGRERLSQRCAKRVLAHLWKIYREIRGVSKDAQCAFATLRTFAFSAMARYFR
jgi:hypothetical protein